MDDKALVENLFNQVMEIWILPEIDRRQLAGTLPKPVDLRRAQVLLSIGDVPQVRLNDEVKAIMEGRLKVAKEEGELIYADEVESIEFVGLLEEDQNFAHITMTCIDNGWHIACNFLYETRDAKAALALGKEFLDSATADAASQRMRSSVNNLFIAAEQIARAALILRPLEGGYRKAKTHRPLGAAINRYSKIEGIIPAEYAAAYNKVNGLVAKARYDPELTIHQDELGQMIEHIEQLWARLDAELNTDKRST